MKKQKLSILIAFAFIPIGTILGQEETVQKSFNLKESIAYGLEHHLSVEISNNNIEVAHQQVREYMASYLPQVSASANITDNLKLQQTVIPEGTFGPGSPEQRIAFGTQWNSMGTVQLDQMIYNQSMLTGISASKKNKEMSEMQAAQNNDEVIYNIASSYFQVLVTQKQLDLLQDNKSRLEELLRTTKLQAEQGVAKKIDVSQVQVNYNNVLSSISTVENALRMAKNVLKINMGLSVDDELVLENTEKWIENNPSLTAYEDFNYESTLSGRLQALQIELLELNRKSIKAQFIPSLSLFARYGANTMSQELSGLYNPLLDYSSIGVQLSWNIFTGFRRNAQVKQAALDLNNAKLNYDLTASMQNLQYQNAESASTDAQRTIIMNKDNMELAQEVYENTTLQYQQGAASMSDLLNAEISYKEAQSNYINALLQFYIADLSVHQANGTLEEYFNNL